MKLIPEVEKLKTRYQIGAMSAEEFALAIQNAVAAKCVEIARDEFLHRQDYPEAIAYNVAVGHVIGAIRSHFQLPEKP